MVCFSISAHKADDLPLRTRPVLVQEEQDHFLGRHDADVLKQLGGQKGVSPHDLQQQRADGRFADTEAGMAFAGCRAPILPLCCHTNNPRVNVGIPTVSPSPEGAFRGGTPRSVRYQDQLDPPYRRHGRAPGHHHGHCGMVTVALADIRREWGASVAEMWGPGTDSQHKPNQSRTDQRGSGRRQCTPGHCKSEEEPIKWPQALSVP